MKGYLNRHSRLDDLLILILLIEIAWLNKDFCFLNGYLELLIYVIAFKSNTRSVYFLVCSIRTAWSVGPYSYNIYVGISDSSWQQAEIILEIISNIRDHIYRHFTPLLIFLEILPLILPANFFPLNLRI